MYSITSFPVHHCLFGGTIVIRGAAITMGGFYCVFVKDWVLGGGDSFKDMVIKFPLESSLGLWSGWTIFSYLLGTHNLTPPLIFLLP